MRLRLLRFPWFAAMLCAAASASFAADSAPFSSPPPIVYVADFDLDAANVAPDSGPGQRVRRLRGLLPDGPGPLGQDSNPQEHAQHIVNEMADALTGNLRRGGVDARRMARDQPLPADAWQVRGVFLNVDDGNRLRRAIVGLGAGQNDIQVAVSCDPPGAANLPPLYQTVDEAGNGNRPGAFIKLNPYVIAAKFVMASGDEKKTITQAAKQISDAVLAKLHAQTR